MPAGDCCCVDTHSLGSRSQHGARMVLAAMAQSSALRDMVLVAVSRRRKKASRSVTGKFRMGIKQTASGQREVLGSHIRWVCTARLVVVGDWILSTGVSFRIVASGIGLEIFKNYYYYYFYY